MTMQETLDSFFKQQLAEWPLLKANHETLAQAPRSNVELPGSSLPVGFTNGNASMDFKVEKILLTHRRQSLTADLGKISRGERPCFLCPDARPAEQSVMRWRNYEILCNPYPAARPHFTIVNAAHTPQCIEGRVTDMVMLAAELPACCVFYNGPRCGASAPDHQHFQAIPVGYASNFIQEAPLPNQPFCFLTIDIDNAAIDKAERGIGEIMQALPHEGCAEPMVNILAFSFNSDTVRVIIIPRRAHRPSCYGSSKGQLLVSPASIEMAGHFITSREEDFSRLDAETILRIYCETAFKCDELGLPAYTRISSKATVFTSKASKP